jgi:hypothetical protein
MPASPPEPSPPTSAPRWAQLADLLSLLLVVVAVVVSITGGFRMRLGGVRLAITSPYRLLLWAIGIAIVRHLVVRSSPIYRDLPARLAASWRTPAGRTAIGALTATRLPILLIGYLAVFMVGYPQQGAPFKLHPNEFVNLQARWDTGWYFGIAIEGYSYVPRRPNDQQSIVFFPAFPLLMRIAGRLLGGTSPAFMLGGTVVVLLAFLGAAAYLFRFARDYLDDDQSRQAVWLLASYPFAAFFSALYTESIFLLGALGAFWHFRRRELVRAGAWGLLVGLTRPNGCFLSIPLAILAVTPWLPRRLAGGPDREAPAARLASVVPAMAAAAMPGIGVLIYSAYMWRVTGDPLAWAAGHIAWGRQYEGVGTLFSDHFGYLSEVGVYAYTSQLPADVMNAVGAIFVLALAWPVARRLGLAYAVFILINILPPLAAGGFMSAGRFSAVLFPAFVWLASAIPAGQRVAWVAAFMAFQGFIATLFYTWRPMF